MSEPDPKIGVEEAAVANGSGPPPEVSGAETISEKKDLKVKNGAKEVVEAADVVEEAKDAGGENGEEGKDGEKGAKYATETIPSEVVKNEIEKEEVVDEIEKEEVKDETEKEEVKGEIEKDDVEETKEMDEKNKMEVEKEENGEGETKNVVEETKEMDEKDGIEVEKVEKESNTAEETKEGEKMTVEETENEEEKDSVEQTKNVEERDSAEESKNGAEKKNVEEKASVEEKMDEEEDSAQPVNDKEEGKDEKETEDVEMKETEDVEMKETEDVEMKEAEDDKDGEEVKLGTGGKEENEVEAEKDDAKAEEGENTEEVDEKVIKRLKKKRGKRGKAGGTREPKVKKVGEEKEKEKEKEKEEGDNKEKEEGDNKEKKVGEKKEKKEGDKKAKDSSHTPPPIMDRPVRERKTVERLVEVIEKEPNKRVIIEKGRGTPLKDIPNVAHKLARKKPGDLKLLHQMLFGRIGKAADFKHHILQFSGFVWHESDEKQGAKIKEKLDKCAKDSLVDLCDLFDIPVSRVNSKKEDLLVKLLDFLAAPAPYVATDVTLAEKDQQTPKSGKRKRATEGSASKSREDMVSKKSNNKRTKSEDTPSDKGKGAQDSEEEENEEEDNENGLPDEDEKFGDLESEKVSKSEDAAEEEDDYEDSGKGKQNTAAPPKQTVSSGKEKLKVGSNSKKEKAPSVTSAKSPKKTPSSGKNPIKTPSTGKKPTKTPPSTHSSKSDERNDVGEKVFSRKKKNVDSPKKKSASKSDIKAKSSVKKVGKGKPKSEDLKSEEGGQYGPRTAQLRKTICEILTKVDFNTATFTDILKRLATHYKVDLTPRKSSIKQIIKEELTKLAEEDEDEDEAEEEDNRKPTSEGVKA